MATAEITKLIHIYAAIPGRPPLPEGLNFWSSVLDQGFPMEYVVSEMWNSAGAKALYPDTMSIRDVVTNIYRNVLGREPADEGLDFWSKHWVDHGEANTLLVMTNSIDLWKPEDPNDLDEFDLMVLKSQALWNHKIEIGEHLAIELQSSDSAFAETIFSYLDGTEEGLANAYEAINNYFNDGSYSDSDDYLVYGSELSHLLTPEFSLLARGGDDTVTLILDNNTLAGNIDGGAGNDTLILKALSSNSFGFDDLSLTGFETLVVEDLVGINTLNLDDLGSPKVISYGTNLATEDKPERLEITFTGEGLHPSESATIYTFSTIHRFSSNPQGTNTLPPDYLARQFAHSLNTDHSFSQYYVASTDGAKLIIIGTNVPEDIENQFRYEDDSATLDAIVDNKAAESGSPDGNLTINGLKNNAVFELKDVIEGDGQITLNGNENLTIVVDKEGINRTLINSGSLKIDNVTTLTVTLTIEEEKHIHGTNLKLDGPDVVDLVVNGGGRFYLRANDLPNLKSINAKDLEGVLNLHDQEIPFYNEMTITGSNYSQDGAGDSIIIHAEKSMTLYGLGGNDTLIGANEGDDIYGGPGDDKVYGRGGKDFLSGGSGVDTFYFKMTSSTENIPDTITDYEAIDRLVFFADTDNGDYGEGITRPDLIASLLNTSNTDAGQAHLLAVAETSNEVGLYFNESNQTLYVDGDSDGDADIFVEMLGVNTLTSDLIYFDNP